MRIGELGFWWRDIGGLPAPRAPLPGPIEADVAIVGGGLTGLWSAYYLKQEEPALRVVVLEAEQAGFGAAGRNGGWLSGFFSGPARVYERGRPAGGYAAMQRAMFATVDEVAAVLSRHTIDAELVKGGVLTVALDAPQLARVRDSVAAARAAGLAEQDLRVLGAEELSARVAVAGALGASFSPHVARLHPAKLVVGLAGAAEQLGVEIYERTPVTAIAPRRALTAAGTVDARWVVRATEGYTASLRGERRSLAPVNSSMIVTEPLSDAAWAEIGWQNREVMGDNAHVYVYLQRTADGRIAIGGRGAPYRFGSRTGGRGDTPVATVRSLQEQLAAMFPAAADARVEHAWSGVLGVPRDWCVSVAADPKSGLVRAGGYVGEGVAAANLAARIVRDLVLGGDSELTALPWVGRAPRRWEPEPLRWAGIHSVYSLYRRADRAERRTGRASRLAALVDRVSGRE